jgi:hypothetical protein
MGQQEDILTAAQLVLDVCGDRAEDHVAEKIEAAHAARDLVPSRDG